MIYCNTRLKRASFRRRFRLLNHLLISTLPMTIAKTISSGQDEMIDEEPLKKKSKFILGWPFKVMSGHFLFSDEAILPFWIHFILVLELHLNLEDRT